MPTGRVKAEAWGAGWSSGSRPVSPESPASLQVGHPAWKGSGKLPEGDRILVPAFQPCSPPPLPPGAAVWVTFTSRTLSAVSEVRISTSMLLPSGRNMSREAFLAAMPNVSCEHREGTVSAAGPQWGPHRGAVSSVLSRPRGSHPEAHEIPGQKFGAWSLGGGGTEQGLGGVWRGAKAMR